MKPFAPKSVDQGSDDFMPAALACRFLNGISIAAICLTNADANGITRTGILSASSACLRQLNVGMTILALDGLPAAFSAPV